MTKIEPIEVHPTINRPSRESGILLFAIGLAVGAVMVIMFWIATGA